MATASVTYSFSPSTLILSSEVNTNFADLVSFLNGDVIHSDGSVAATAHLSGPSTDPSSSTQYANKQYVDKLGIVRQESLTSNSASWAASTTTDMNLDNVSVIAGRTYGVHLHTQYSFTSVDLDAAWSVNLLLNGAALDRFEYIAPRITGVLTSHVDATVYWTPSVTAATDDLAVNVTLQSAGAPIQFLASATARRTLTLIDLGVL